MPMLGVISETLESEGGSMSGDEDFFSVARTIPFVAAWNVNICTSTVDKRSTFDSQGCYALIDGCQGIL